MKITLDKKKKCALRRHTCCNSNSFCERFCVWKLRNSLLEPHYVFLRPAYIISFFFLPNRYQYVRQLPNNVFDNLRQYCNFIAICPKIEAVCLLRTNVSEVHILLHLLTWWFNHVWIIFVMHFKSPKMHTWATSSKKGYDLRGGILNLDKYIGGTKLF